MKLKTILLSAIFFLLPWQTRWIFGQTLIDGAASPFGALSVYAVEILVLVTALVTVAVKSQRPTIDKSYRAPIALAIGVLVVSALSLLWSDFPQLSLNQLFHVGCAMVLFTLVLDRKVEIKPILLSFGAGLLVPFGLGVWQVLFDSSPASTIFGLALRDAQALGDVVTVAEDGTRQLRAYGSFPHPNIFGGFLAVGVLALRAVWDRGMKSALRWALPIAMLVLLIGLWLTASRAAVLGLVLGIFLAGLVGRMKNMNMARIVVIPIAFVVIGGAFLATLWAPGVIASLRGGGATEERSITERMVQFKEYPDVVDGNWLLGHGLGTYVFEVAETKPSLEVWEYQPVHNVPLLIVGELGLLGALIVFAWSSTIDKMNFARFPNRDALMAFAMGNVVLVILFFDHWIWSQWGGLALIALVMALTVRMGEKA